MPSFILHSLRYGFCIKLKHIPLLTPTLLLRLEFHLPLWDSKTEVNAQPTYCLMIHAQFLICVRWLVTGTLISFYLFQSGLSHFSFSITCLSVVPALSFF